MMLSRGISALRLQTSECVSWQEEDGAGVVDMYCNVGFAERYSRAVSLLPMMQKTPFSQMSRSAKTVGKEP